MSEIERLFDELDAPTDEVGRAIIIDFLNTTRTDLLKGKISPVEGAYAIAGLMGTDFARRLSEDDPIDEVLVIAGELEANPADAGSLYQELISRISAL